MLACGFCGKAVKDVRVLMKGFEDECICCDCVMVSLFELCKRDPEYIQSKIDEIEKGIQEAQKQKRGDANG